MPNTVDLEVSDLSIRGRLAIALCCFQLYCRVRELSHPEIDAFADYMWEFMVLHGDNTFSEWEERQPVLVSVGLGDEYPVDFRTFLTSSGVSEGDFRLLLENITEIVFCSAYAATDDAESRAFLAGVILAVGQYGVRPPSPSLFGATLWKDAYGWGEPVPLATILEWKQLGSQ
jgi:hypothetical protein